MNVRVVEGKVPVLHQLAVQVDVGSLRPVVDGRLMIAELQPAAQRGAARNIDSAEVGIPEIPGVPGNGRIDGGTQVIAREEGGREWRVEPRVDDGRAADVGVGRAAGVGECSALVVVVIVGGDLRWRGMRQAIGGRIVPDV